MLDGEEEPNYDSGAPSIPVDDADLDAPERTPSARRPCPPPAALHTAHTSPRGATPQGPGGAPAGALDDADLNTPTGHTLGGDFSTRPRHGQGRFPGWRSLPRVATIASRLGPWVRRITRATLPPAIRNGAG